MLYMVTLCVRVWIEIVYRRFNFAVLPVTLCVRVWIEIVQYTMDAVY